MKKIYLLQCTLLCISVCSTLAVAQYPYPSEPLELKIEPHTVKPNILLFMDNSGSMSMARHFFYDDKGKRSRFSFAKQVVRNLMLRYKNDARWGLASYDEFGIGFQPKHELILYNPNGYNPQPCSPYPAFPKNAGCDNHLWGGDESYGDTYYQASDKLNNELKKDQKATHTGAVILVPIADTTDAHINNIHERMDRIRMKWHTPMTSGLYEMSRYFRGLTSAYNKPIPGVNYPLHNTGFWKDFIKNWNRPNPKPANLAQLKAQSERYESPIQYRCQKNIIIMTGDDRPYSTYNWRALWPAVADPHFGQATTKEYVKANELNQSGTSGTLGLGHQGKGSSYPGVAGQGATGFNKYDHHDYSGMYTEDGGLQFISHYMAQTDLVQAANGGLVRHDLKGVSRDPALDLEGKSFDDPAFNNGKQTINTLFLGFDGLGGNYIDKQGNRNAKWERMRRAAVAGSDFRATGKGMVHEATMSARLGIIESLDDQLHYMLKSTTTYSPIPSEPMGPDNKTLIISNVNVLTWSSDIKFCKTDPQTGKAIEYTYGADGKIAIDMCRRPDYSINAYGNYSGSTQKKSNIKNDPGDFTMNNPTAFIGPFTLFNTPTGVIKLQRAGRQKGSGYNVNSINTIRSSSESGFGSATLNNALFGIAGTGIKIDEYNRLSRWLLRVGNPENGEADGADKYLRDLPAVPQPPNPDCLNPLEYALHESCKNPVPTDPGSIDDTPVYRLRDVYDSRNRYVGDIIDNDIIVFGQVIGGNHKKLTDAQYSLANAAQKKESDMHDPKYQYFMTGANDGMFHLFKALDLGSKAAPYQRIFNYIPGAAQRETASDTITKNLFHTSQANYGDKVNPHQYYVNGGMMWQQTSEKGNSEGHIFMVGTLGQGGRAAYSLSIGGKRYGTNDYTGLEITAYNDGTFNGGQEKRILLWDTSTSNFGNAAVGTEKIGYTISTPVIGRVDLNRINKKATLNKHVLYTTFLANGYDGTEDRPTLYLLDSLGVNAALTQDGTGGYQLNNIIQHLGSLIAKISVPNSNGVIKNGLSSPAVIDLNLNGIHDIAYAGDLNGNIYRFDFRGDDYSKWSAGLLYEGNPTQPITSAPTVDKIGNNYIVIFGTGSVIYGDDMANNDLQTLYGIVDDISVEPQNIIPVKFSDRGDSNIFFAQRLRTENKTRYLKEDSQMEITQRGWYLDLTVLGERIVRQPEMINKTLHFSTRVIQLPDYSAAKSCNNDSYTHGWLMSVTTRGGIPEHTAYSNPDDVNNNPKRQIGAEFKGTLSRVISYVDNPLGKMPVASNSVGMAQSGISLHLNAPNKVLDPCDEIDANGKPIEGYNISTTSSEAGVGQQNGYVKCITTPKNNHPARIYIYERI